MEDINEAAKELTYFLGDEGLSGLPLLVVIKTKEDSETVNIQKIQEMLAEGIISNRKWRTCLLVEYNRRLYSLGGLAWND